MENLFEICNYFEITPSEFFDADISDPIKTKEIYLEIQRICNNDADSILQILNKLDSADYCAIQNIIKKLSI